MTNFSLRVRWFGIDCTTCGGVAAQIVEAAGPKSRNSTASDPSDRMLRRSRIVLSCQYLSSGWRHEGSKIRGVTHARKWFYLCSQVLFSERRWRVGSIFQNRGGAEALPPDLWRGGQPDASEGLVAEQGLTTAVGQEPRGCLLVPGSTAYNTKIISPLYWSEYKKKELLKWQFVQIANKETPGFTFEKL